MSGRWFATLHEPLLKKGGQGGFLHPVVNVAVCRQEIPPTPLYERGVTAGAFCERGVNVGPVCTGAVSANRASARDLGSWI
jgi:hypothetical protein